MKKGKSTIRIFSDKTSWTVHQGRNPRNYQYLTFSVQDVSPPPINVTTRPASIMTLGLVASDGNRMHPLWFLKDLKVGAKEYLDVMETKVKPWLEATYPRGGYVWQQGSAPAHKTKVIQEWCRDSLPDFWPWSKRPPSSPSVTSVDDGIWGAVEDKT